MRCAVYGMGGSFVSNGFSVFRKWEMVLVSGWLTWWPGGCSVAAAWVRDYVMCGCVVDAGLERYGAVDANRVASMVDNGCAVCARGFRDIENGNQYMRNIEINK